jgi:hypothetical protein
MLRTLVLLAGAIVSLAALPLNAQDAVLSRLYGDGVHAFLSGDFAKSHERLTAAIDAGSLDPRVYYFRGLDYLKLGREPEAIQDFQKGAELECKDKNRSYNVPRSLERIQGTMRLLLDKYRVEARKASYAEANKYRKARFEEIRREEHRVLRDQTGEPASEAVPAPAAEAEPGAKATKLDVFGNPQEAKNAAKADEVFTEDKPAGKPDVEEEPAADGTMAEQPAMDQPVAEQPTAEKSATEKPAAERPTARKTTIFNALIKGSSEGVKKSFGDVKKMLPFGKAAPGAKKPAGTAQPAGGDDLFGAGPEEKKAEMPEKPKKADPFKPEEPEASDKPAADKKPAPADKPEAGSDDDLFK